MQVPDRLCDLACRAEASDRDPGGNVGLLQRLGHLGIDRPGCDGIDG